LNYPLSVPSSFSEQFVKQKCFPLQDVSSDKKKKSVRGDFGL